MKHALLIEFGVQCRSTKFCQENAQLDDEDTNNHHYLFFDFLHDAWNDCAPEQYHFGTRRG